MEWTNCKFEGCERKFVKDSMTVIGEVPQWVSQTTKAEYCMTCGMSQFLYLSGEEE